jgi:hypothetical protein
MWAIPLTALGVFIILNLLRNKEEARRRRPPLRESRPEDADEPSGRRQEPVTDFDRYLQDFQRRRRATERGEQRPRLQPPVRRDQTAQSRPRRANTASSRPSAPRASVDAPLARQSTARPLQTDVIPYALPVNEPTSLLPAALAPIPVTPATAFPVIPTAPPVARGAGTTSMLRPGVAQGSFKALLQSRQNLRSAIILREILDPPLSKRRRM